MQKIIDYIMNLFYLPSDLRKALNNLNLNYLTEIRLRNGQPVIIEYCNEYKYINYIAATDKKENAIVCKDAGSVLYSAIENCVYSYTEQLKKGFVTVDGGVRIGIAGEYVSDKGGVSAIKNVTSLNLRIPHDAEGCSEEIFNALFKDSLKSTLIFSPAGYGKTTILRDLARKLSVNYNKNLLIFDERYEISGADGTRFGFELGARCDVVRGADKIYAFENAVRAMKPQIIITDELYGAQDMQAVQKAIDCGVCVIASSHIIDVNLLKNMPFDYFIGLGGIGQRAEIYDKNFNSVCDCGTVGRVRSDFIK